ncbi:MAG: peptide chain release factor 1 [SAR202 cluster bacterium]|nr:peptide chain release factor 1 [SAR202 cluster bacterium]
MASILDKLDPVMNRYHEIEESMADPEISTDFERVQELAKERASLESLVNIGGKYKVLVDEIEDLQSLVRDGSDPELVLMAKEEMEEAQGKLEALAQELRVALLPKNPNDERDVIIEVRAGTGGGEASIFAADLYRAYTRYAQNQGWKVEVMDSSPTEVGGFNKIVFQINGKGVFSRIKFESGVHRVQRIPNTETQGRIHTSTATVVVLPVVDEVEFKVNLEELRIDVFHAGGHGGQNVNKVATAIRIVHEPTGLTVVCQDERSQHKNKERAMSMLRSRLFEAEENRKDAEVSEARRSQVAGAERSEKIRTYNYPQDRVTDHRSNVNFHGIPKLMDGGFEDMFDRLSAWEEERLLDDATE